MFGPYKLQRSEKFDMNPRKYENQFHTLTTTAVLGGEAMTTLRVT